MASLTSEQLEHFKNKLVEKKQYLESQLQIFAKKNENIKNDYETVFEQIGDGAEENADEVTTYADNLAIEHELEDNLTEIEDALGRIADGTYGICSDCKEPMNIDRLEALPEAILCIKCEK